MGKRSGYISDWPVKKLSEYLPGGSISFIYDFLSNNNVELKLAKSRQSKKGDFAIKPNKHFVITVNHDLNKFDFLITLLHEIAHFLSWKKNKNLKKPHGKEWRNIYKALLNEMISQNVFPDDISKVICSTIIYPENFASNYKKRIDLVLQSYSKQESTLMVKDLEVNNCFELISGRKFRIIEKMRKRYKCIDLTNRKIYIVIAEAKVKNVISC